MGTTGEYGIGTILLLVKVKELCPNLGNPRTPSSNIHPIALLR